MKDRQEDNKNTGSCLIDLVKVIFILGVLFLLWFAIRWPDYKELRNQRRVDLAESKANTIHDALATYSKRNSEGGYPHHISDYDDLRRIINQYGGLLPENQSDLAFAQIYYCSDDSKSYKMAIKVDLKLDERFETALRKFLIITPKGVTRRSKISIPSPGCNVKEVDRDGRFIAYDDGTVTDTETGLMWASSDSRSYRTNLYAKLYCEHYGVGFYNNWRIPTIDELLTLFDKSKTNIYLNHLTRLININGDCVWSSDYDKENKIYALYSFKTGIKSWDNVTGSQGYIECRALPVREIKSEKSNIDRQK